MCSKPTAIVELILLFLALPSAAYASETCDVTFQSLLMEMADRTVLARTPEPAYFSKAASSYERASIARDKPGWFANRDWSWYVRSEKNEGRQEWVLMDVAGPGALTRMWVGGHPDQDGTLRFYLDGSESPFWSSRASEVVGTNSAVGSPLSSRSFDKDVLDGGAKPGHNLYVPIPYAKNLKITYDVPPDHSNTSTGFWYNINYRSYSPGTKVESFDADSLKLSDSLASKQLTKVNSLLLRPTLSSRSDENRKFTSSQRVAAGESLSQNVTGEGAIRRLALQFHADDISAALRETILEISFDGQQTVKAPIGLFFGAGTERVNLVQEWYRTVDPKSQELVAYWVMPYQESLELRVINGGTQEISTKLDLEVSDWKWTERTMYFHASFREQLGLPTKARVGQDWNFVTIHGKGLYVGDTLQVSKNIGGWWGEGDEKIYIDGESFPSHFGTGTEDYYGYAWGHRETFTQPFISQPQADGNYLKTGGATVNSRVRALDAIPFEKSLKVDMEVWNWHGGPVDYSVATFWYGTPDSKEPDPR